MAEFWNPARPRPAACRGGTFGQSAAAPPPLGRQGPAARQLHPSPADTDMQHAEPARQSPCYSLPVIIECCQYVTREP